MNYLVEKFKASIYERTGDGSTLMHIAAINGHPSTAVALHEKGVIIFISKTFLGFACRFNIHKYMALTIF